MKHQHTKRPKYGVLDSWGDDPSAEWRDDVHGVSRSEYEQLHPVVFDIETTTETPKRPFLVTVYDELDAELHVAYVHGYQGAEFDGDDELAERVTGAFGHGVESVTFHRNVSQSWFENWVLQRVANHPQKCLVGHNVSFDLGLLASPDPGAFDAFDMDPTQWDGAMTYRDVTCFFKRAGAFGKLYTFRPQKNIPVVDTQTVAKSLWHPAALDSLAEEFDLGGIDADGHGVLDAEYLLYNVDDVRQTTEVFHLLTDELQDSFSTDMTPDRVFSTASIAKDVLARMGYDRTHYTEQAGGIIAPSYFGGNTEALDTGRRIDGVTYMDILSQYPTVCGLTGVWEAMRAETVDVSSIPPRTLPRPSLDDLQDAETWRNIAPYYVAVKADDATLPVRGKMEGTQTTRVYNADVTHDGHTTVHHLMDVIGAWLRGDDVTVCQAWKVELHGTQQTSSTQVGSTSIGATDNVMVRAIEERKKLQAQFGGKNQRTKSLKITANSSYGISAERIVEEVGEPGQPDHERYDVAGKFYNPHTASTITAGGRLMLTLGELVAEQAGGKLYYCDTDSLIVDDHVADEVQAAFADLNPYTEGPVADAEVLEVEDGKDGRPLRDVSLFALGVKKYAVLDGRELVKYTEHGLGAFNTLRGSETVRKFWTTLLTRLYDVDVDGPTFTQQEVTQPLVWQQGASTETVRSVVNQYVADEFRFGDWVERVIDMGRGGEKTVYIGADVTERAVKLTEHADGTFSDPEVLDAEQLRDERLKTVLDLLHEWQQNQTVRANQYDRRPDVTIDGTEVVTKEASSEVQALEAVVTTMLHVCESIGTLFD